MEKEIQKKQWITPELALIGSALIESGIRPAHPESVTYQTHGLTYTGSGS
ncbi:MAG: hypothetical protein ACXVJD_09700 [Mucilaginibacter sp.]